MRHKEIVLKRMKRTWGCERASVDSRQQKAARVRRTCLAQITAAHGPEPRRVRRMLGLARARNARKQGNAASKGPRG
jgi:hypothetical protein